MKPRQTPEFFMYILCLGLLALGQVSYGQKDFYGSRVSLDEDWKFQLGDNSSDDYEYHIYSKDFMPFGKAGRMKGVNALEFDDSTWQDVTLPHDWAVHLPFVREKSLNGHGFKPVGWNYPESSEGWYRKKFTIAETNKDKRMYLKFDGVYRDCQVWLNGYYLGRNMSGYIGFTYEITDFVEFEQENLLVVKVDATEYEGWWYEGAGIYRHTWLITKSTSHLPEYGTYVTTAVKENEAEVNVATEIIVDAADANNKVQLKLEVKAPDGKIIAKQTQPVNLANTTTTKVISQLTVENPQLWSTEDPNMYQLVSSLTVKGKVKDQVTTPFGVRTLRFDANEGFFLNGKAVKIKGACMHQDHAGVGVAVPDRLQYYRIEKLKEMGTNAYRSTHHPPAPEIVRACDELGMLIIPENRSLISSPEYQSQLSRLILNYRNSPSVMMWSLGNEEMNIQDKPTGKRVAQRLLQLQRELDPSRWSTYGGNNGNKYFGTNEVMDVRGFNYMNISDIDEYHRLHPDQPLIGSEEASTLCTRGQYVYDSLRGYLPDYDKKVNIPYVWCANAEEWWSFYDARPFLMGGFIWTGFDYRGEPSPFRKTSINSHFGVMDVCGFPKNNYYYYKAWWTDEDVLHLYPHWNWEGKAGETINVWAQTNADEVELFLNGKSQGKRTVEKNKHVEWEVVYEPGVLEARALKDGRELVQRVETTGKSAEIVIEPDRTLLTADGKDLSVINISVKDLQGRAVPDASDFIVFEVEGAGKIIGVGNGDPNSTEPDKINEGPYYRKLFNGKCQVILQTTKETGTITFKASSEQLKSSVVQLTSK